MDAYLPPQTKVQPQFRTTFTGLDSAKHLYESFGFVLREEWEDAHWGKTVLAQKFELDL
jgi:hypothetical protein